MLNTTPDVEKYLDRLVAFVLSYRTDKCKAYKGWSEYDIRNTLHIAMIECSMCSITDVEGNVVGVCNGEADHKNKIFHVNNILAHPGHMKTFLRMFDVLFPNYDLSADRRGHRVDYDLQKLKAKFFGLNPANN